MRRRDFLRAAAAVPAAALGGCRLTVEQGLMGACETGIDLARNRWVENAWQGLRRA